MIAPKVNAEPKGAARYCALRSADRGGNLLEGQTAFSAFADLTILVSRPGNASVFGLLEPSRPFAVARLIIAVVVDALDAEALTGVFAHIGQEVLELVPAWGAAVLRQSSRPR
ncbi:hypothetical protein ACVMIH_000051 [Bradyrhizobium sp. USDA 4503]